MPKRGRGPEPAAKEEKLANRSPACDGFSIDRQRPAPCRLGETASLVTVANLLTFLAMPDLLSCSGQDGPRAGREPAVKREEEEPATDEEVEEARRTSRSYPRGR
jgi:hypothetical protein